MPPLRDVPHIQQTSWMGVASLLLPVTACALILAVGFGAGTACTDFVQGGSMSKSPCVLVTYWVEACIAAEVVFLVVALLLRAWRRSSSAAVVVLVVLEAVVFVTSAVAAFKVR